jgi:hypothetical protein
MNYNVLKQRENNYCQKINKNWLLKKKQKNSTCLAFFLKSLLFPTLLEIEYYGVHIESVLGEGSICWSVQNFR